MRAFADLMWLLSWASGRVGGLSLVSLLFLCYWVISSQIGQTEERTQTASWSTKLFAYYSLLIHILVVVFPVRACWATWDITRALKKMARTRNWKNSKSSPRLSSSSSSSSFSSAETLTPTQASPSPACSDAGDMELGYYADHENDPPKNIHAILIPNYKEEIDVLEETLSVLASHPLARSEYDVGSTSKLCDFKVTDLPRFTLLWRPENLAVKSKQCTSYRNL